jgi:hypothetical protein
MESGRGCENGRKERKQALKDIRFAGTCVESQEIEWEFCDPADSGPVPCESLPSHRVAGMCVTANCVKYVRWRD